MIRGGLSMELRGYISFAVNSVGMVNFVVITTRPE
jgi:hypothetical protein